MDEPRKFTFPAKPYNEQYEKRIRMIETEQLFLRQKEILDTFLERGAITQAQHDKSLYDLREKMGLAEDN